MKFVVYSSDDYYPSAEEFDDYISAMKAFSTLKSARINSTKYNDDPFSDKDYLCIVIDEIDIKKLVELRKLGDKLDSELND
jgi:hypothetical protein